MPVLLGFFALVLTLVALKAYTKASPAALAQIIRRGGGFALMALGGLLLLRGRLDLGLALGGFGFWLMGFSSPGDCVTLGQGALAYPASVPR